MNLQEVAADFLLPAGFEVLELQVQNMARNPIVLVRIDRLDEQPVTVEDLELASNMLSLEFDRLDPFPLGYRLEFESPGAKRPLTRARHFQRMIGLKAKVRISGHGFTAAILAVEGDQVTFDHGDPKTTLTIGNFEAHLAEFPPSHR